MSSYIRVFEHVFGSDFMHTLLQTESLDLQRGQFGPLFSALNRNLPSIIHLDNDAEHQPSSDGSAVDHLRDGCVGNVNVSLDLLEVTNRISSYDSLKIIGLSHFDTAKSNCGVFRGKWQYEVLLLSSGIMQMGWAAFRSTFGSGQGVGDTSNSYAFDGCRVCKWNVVAESYGEKWDEYDVIGCCIDLDEGNIEFFRNGTSMGVAYRNIQMGAELVYFPSISLQQREGLIVNFGSTPFHYPVPSYQPMQKCPQRELPTVTHLLSCLSKLLPLMDSRAAEFDIRRDGTTASYDAIILELGNILVSSIIPFLKNPYILETKFIPFIRSLCDPVTPHATQSQIRPSARIGATKGTQVIFANNRKLNSCLDLFWVFSEKNDLKEWTSLLVSRLSSKFQHITRPQVLEFSQQKDAILVLHSFIHHKNFCQFLMSHVLFEGVNLLWLMNIKVPSFEANPLWETEPSLEINKRTFMSSVSRVSLAIHNLEELQIDLILTMMDKRGDSDSSPCSRKVFLDKFRILRRQFYAIDRVDPLKSPGNPLVLVQPFLLRLLRAFEILWSREMETFTPIVVPSIKFFDGAIQYYDIDRLGGVLLYLLKTYQIDVEQRLEDSQPVQVIPNERDDPQSFTESSTSTVRNRTDPDNLADLSSRVFEIFDDIASIVTWNDHQGNSLSSTHPILHTATTVEAKNFLFEILDSLIFFYHISFKTNSMSHEIDSVQKEIRTLMQLSCEHKEAINGLKASYGTKQQSEILKSLEQSNHCVLEHLQRATAHLVTVYALRYPSRHSLLYKVILNTMKASADDGHLFNFVPEFYLDCMVNILKELQSDASSFFPQEDYPVPLEDRDYLTQEIITFFCDHIQDQRVRIAKAKDTLLFALLDIVTSSSMLEVLHQVPLESQLNMIRFLLQPYENRAWANSNWILVRIWHGSPSCFACGGHWSMFHRNKLRPKPLSYPINPLSFERDPSPSPILQELIQNLLVNEPNTASAFINSVLNQLNWAFSEFIGMLQELQNASSRHERVLVESRQLKICATCYDLTLALLRVLEMVASLAVPVFVRQDQPNSIFLLARLFQLLCQVMTRASSQDGCFHHIITLEIPGLENVNHLPILTSVCGILLGILREDMENFDKGLPNTSVPNATKTLLLEPSFQLSSINFLLEDNPHLYSLKFYEEFITARELAMVEKMLAMLNHYHHILAESSTASNVIDEDEVCTICFAFPISASFEPCHHRSCQACITHHLMNCTNCFFCKTIITKVFDESGKVLYIADKGIHI